MSVAQEDAFTLCGAANLRLVRLDAVEKGCLRPLFEHIFGEALPVFVGHHPADSGRGRDLWFPLPGYKQGVGQAGPIILQCIVYFSYILYII